MSRKIDKIIAMVVSDRYYLVNFYECAFQRFFTSDCTTVYCNPFAPLPESVLEKIKSSPSMLVALLPDPDINLGDVTEEWIEASRKNWMLLRDKFLYCCYMSNFVYNFKADEDLKFETICNEMLRHFDDLKYTLETFDKIFKNEIFLVKMHEEMKGNV